jgi:hypothetical protein
MDTVSAFPVPIECGVQQFVLLRLAATPEELAEMSGRCNPKIGSASSPLSLGQGRVSLRHEAAMNQPFAETFDPLQSVTLRRVAPQSDAR